MNPHFPTMLCIRRDTTKLIILVFVITAVLSVCVKMYVKYGVSRAGPKSTIASELNKLYMHLIRGKVANQESFENPLGRPYLIPDDEILSTLKETELMDIYWRYVNTLQILCRNQSRLGHLRDGGKEVCLDETYKPKKPCIVYSFGSHYQFDFDLEVHNSFGCAVFTFDPSMNINGRGKNRSIPKEITFKEAGLSGKDYVAPNSWQMKTLKTIISENGHQEKFIDILKMDVEGAEWDSIPNILESGAYRQVKQLLVEFHFGHFMSKPGNRFWGNMDMAKQLRALALLTLLFYIPDNFL